jgi:capsular polysaccharide biosynthesis protein
VKDPDQMGTLSTGDDDLRERLWAYEDFSAAEEHPGIDVTGAFVSLGFLRAALRRRRRLWCATGAIGFVIGCGVYVAYPPAYSATTTLLLTNAAGIDPTTAMQTNVSLAESDAVATAVVKELGLSQSPSSLLAAYTATAPTDEVLQITVNAPSGADAVQRAQAIGTQFLDFRASLLRTQAQQQAIVLNQMVTQSEQSLAALGAKITKLGGTVPSLSDSSSGSSNSSASSSKPTTLSKLETQYTNADNALLELKSQVPGTNVQNQVSVASQIEGSQVLNPATTAKQSRTRAILYDIVAALFGGIVLGMAFVVVQALISDRLRRRDDISLALGAPVKLSVGPVKKSRLALSGRSRANRERDLRRIAMHLHKEMPGKGRGPSTLAVVPLDNTPTIAPAVVRMVEVYAQEKLQVVVADMTEGAQVARLLGVEVTGVQPVRVGNAHLVTFVPELDDVTPSGPLRPLGSGPLASPPSEALVTACRSADIILTIAELNPATGSEHLATWANEAVAIVTAGLTPGARANSVGELLRVSGVHLVSCVLVGADRGDDSLGVITLEPELAGNP